VSRAEAARLKGVQRSSVSKACHPGGALADAVRGTQLDPSDPAFMAWITESPRGPNSAAPVVDPGSPCPTKAQMLELTRRKRAAEAEKLELANAQTREQLISRELVRTHVFGSQEFLNKRLLGDAAKTIASKVFNSVRAKGTLEEAQRIVRDEISKQLRATKDKMIRLLKPRVEASKRARRAPSRSAPKVTKS
jgi:hypothetical protein